MARREIPGIGDLMLVARQLGYRSSKEARQVLKNNGVEGEFDPSNFDEYVAILTSHARTLTSILNKLDNSYNANKAEGEATNRSGNNIDLPARAERVLRAQGQQPWLLRPVAKDERGRTRFINDVEELKKNETLVYEGVTKNEYLDKIAEMEKEDAVDTGKPTHNES